MKRPLIPIPSGPEMLKAIGTDFDEFLAGQLKTYPNLPLPRLLGFLTTQLAIGITERIGAEAAARFMAETLQMVAFTETVVGFTEGDDNDGVN